MLNIQHFACNMLQENCFVVSDETRECVIIDCGAYYGEEFRAIHQYITTEGLTPVHLIATHGHFDHNFGNHNVLEAFGLKVELRAEDAFLIESLPRQMETFGFRFKTEDAPVGHYFADDEQVTFGSHQFEIIHTPGHTPGSCTFYCEEEKLAFSGDTLFRQSMGRTDLEGGSPQQMAESLHRLAKLPADTAVCCGHGPHTTIADELKFNPWFR